MRFVLSASAVALLIAGASAAEIHWEKVSDAPSTANLEANWPDGLHDLIARYRPIMAVARLGNSSAQVFFSNSQEGQQRFVDALACLKRVEVNIVLKPGSGGRVILGGKPYNWLVEIKPSSETENVTRVDMVIPVHVGMTLDHFTAPRGVPIRVSGEIGDFLARHKDQVRLGKHERNPAGS